MKKILAVFVSVVLVFTMSIPAFATNFEFSTGLDSYTQYTTVKNEGEIVPVSFNIENGKIVSARIGDDFAEYVENDVYFNGEYVATITKEYNVINTYTNTIQPRAGWVYLDSCPYGSPSEYNIEFGEEYYNITAAENLASYSFNAMFAVVSAIFVFQGSTTARIVLEEAVRSIVETAAQDPNFGSGNAIHLYDKIYTHAVVGSAFHRNWLRFYTTRNRARLIDDKICYSAWA